MTPALLRWWFPLCAAVCLLAGVPSALGQEAPAAELLVAGETLQPSTTLEVRFAREMVDSDQVGLTVEESPLVITPPIAGSYTWLSRRSGVFVPKQAPSMGTQYQVTLRPGLNDKTGQPVAGSLRQSISTPAFEVISSEDLQERDDVSPFPRIFLTSNRNLNLQSAQQNIRFIAADGRKVEAAVNYPKPEDYFPRRQGFVEGDWDERWQAAQTQPAKAEDADTVVRKYRLQVEPKAALEPGTTWKLVIGAGIEALSSPARTATGSEIVLGRVKPFALEEVLPTSFINSGRRITLRFGQPLADQVNEETATKYFRITPEVPGLKAEVSWDSFAFTGKFELDREYRLQVEPTLISSQGQPISGELAHTFTFEPVRPRAYLPAFTGHQIKAGLRKFPVVSVNLTKLLVTARLVPPEKVPQAVQAFEKYSRDDADGDEAYQPLPAGSVAGKEIFRRELTLPNGPVDERQQTTLDWSEILGGTQAGAVLLTVEGTPRPELAGPKPGAQCLVQLTDVGVLWKAMGDRVRVDLFSMATGRPLPGGKVSVWDREFKSLATATANSEGRAEFPLNVAPAWLSARTADDQQVLAFGDGARDLPMAAFKVPISYPEWGQTADGESALRAYVFTDRPLYRQHETVRIKGYVRSAGRRGLQPVAKTTFTLSITEPRSDVPAQLEVETDAQGNFDTEYGLKSDNLGVAYLSVLGASASFQVAEFQPNAFELSLRAPEVLTGATPVEAKLSGRYLFGAPLENASARWTLQLQKSTFTAPAFSDFYFGDHETSAPALVLNGEGQLPKAGELTIQPRVPAAEGGPQDGLLTVEVTDVNQQTVSEQRAFTRHGSAFYIGVQWLDQSFVGHDEEVPVRAIAVQPNGEPMSEPVPIEAELIRVRYETVRVQGAGGGISFQSERRDEVIAKAQGTTLVPVKAGEDWKVPAGASLKFRPGKAGQYEVRVRAQDQQKAPLMASFMFTADGSEPVIWDYRHPSQVELVPDKPTYGPGETARILVKAPFSGEAMVTVERGQEILSTKRVSLSGNASVVEVPLTGADAPNVFVSLMLLRGAEQSTRQYKVPEFRYGLCELRVRDPLAALEVSVAPQKASVHPREEVSAEITVRDRNGAPVPAADVTFAALDDGVLALTGYQRPAPLAAIHRPVWLAVRTGISLFTLLPEDPAALVFENKGYLIGGGGLGGSNPSLRQNFPGTAAWLPRLQTDAQGRVRAKFAAPDALTRYRLVAVAAKGAGAFGSAEGAVTIRKPVMLLSALGQVARTDDQIIARAVVRNESGANGEAEISLKLDGLGEALKPVHGKLAIKSGEAVTFEVPVRLRGTGEAKWEWETKLAAGGQEFTDGLVSTLRVVSPMPLLRETHLLDLRQPSTNALAAVNPQILEGTGAVRVALTNSRRPNLDGAVEYLREYPYGCAEQQLSGLVPLLTGESTEATRAEISRRLGRLFDTQQVSGGAISYWPGSPEGSYFASAYTALMVQQAAAAGVDAPAGYKGLLDHLTAQDVLAPGARITLEDAALGAWALAAGGQAKPALHEVLFGRLAELSHEARAMLALAVQTAGGPPKMVARLLDLNVPAPDGESWFGGPNRERALRLLAWSRFQPQHKEVSRLLRELSESRENGRWRTTQENAWAVLAITEATTEERLLKPVKGVVEAKGVNIPFALSATQRESVARFPVEPGQPLGALMVKNNTKAPLFGEVVAQAYPPVSLQPRQDRGYAVSRSYWKLGGDGKLAPAENLQVGDRVLVRVQVETSAPGHFVAIDDPVPASLEALNPAFVSQGGDASLTQEPWQADYREMRADRVVYFCDHLRPGKYTFQYLARVRTAGQVSAPGTKVEEMYRPERFGLAEAGIVKTAAR